MEGCGEIRRKARVAVGRMAWDVRLCLVPVSNAVYCCDIQSY
jgi:hypothetical protein